MPLSSRPRLVACLLAHFAALATTHGQTSWDAGGGADTSLDNPANWNSAGNDTLPSFTGSAAVTFATGGSIATVNLDAAFTSVTLNRAGAFTLATGSPTSGLLTLRSVNSGSTPNLLVSTAAGGTQTIDAPLRVDTTNTTNRFLAIANNSAAHTLDLNGGLARSASSTADFALRFYGAAGSTTRIDGPIANLSGFQQIFNTNPGTTWGGDLVFGGSRASTATLSIATASTGNTPAATARLILGESPADVQSWGNLTLNNTIQLVVGGSVSVGTISVGGGATAALTRVLGYSAEPSSLTVTGGSFTANVTLGGPGAHENNFALTKTGAATLTLGGTHTYAGPTTVQGGGLALTGQIASPVVVQAGATLSGEGSTGGALSFGAGVSTLQFNPATEPAAFTAASFSATDATVVVSPSAGVSPGATHTVLRLSAGTFSGAPSAVFAPGARGATLSYANNETELAYTAGSAVAADLVWTGDHGINPTFWDVVATPNWAQSGSPERFYAGDNVRFDDTAASSSVVVQGASVSPGNLVFDHTVKDYVVSGGVIAGTGSLTKLGGGTLTLAQTAANTFSGPLSIQGGTLSLSSLNQIGGASSTRAIGLDGGALAFTGSTATTNTLPVSLGAAGGTFSITGTVLNPDGSTTYQTLRLGAPVTGSGDLIKTGPAILALGQNTAVTLGNTFSGAVHVHQGVLDIRNPDSLGLTSAGTFITDANLALFPFGQNAGVTFAAEPLTFAGTSYLRHQNDDLDSDVVNTLTGPVTVSAGATLGVSAYRAVTLAAGVVVATSPNVSRLVLSGPLALGSGSTLSLGLANPDYVPTALRASATPQEILVSGPVTGAGAVLAQGPESSTFTLSSPGHAGDTTVLGGTLVLGANNPANDSAAVSLAASGARLRLEASDTVARLFLGAAQLPSGTYGATGSGAATIDDARFSGPGVLTVTAGPVADPYAAWASGFGLDGPSAGRDADPDGDGLVNLLEYAVAQDPLVAGSAAAAVVDLADARLRLTFLRARAELTYEVEGSGSLAPESWQHVATNPGAVSLTEPVTVSDSEPVYTTPRRFLRLKISE